MVLHKVKTEVRQSLNAAPLSDAPLPSSVFSVQGKTLLSKQLPITNLQSNSIRSVLDYQHYSAYSKQESVLDQTEQPLEVVID